MRQAEARACDGIDADDRDISPFYHHEDVASVTAAQETVRAGKGSAARTNGARIVFRAVPGMTAEWLQREVDCHLARAAAVRHEMPEMRYCPLMLLGTKASVSSTGNGFAVEITSDDAKSAEEILRRAEALRKPAGPSPSASAK